MLRIRDFIYALCPFVQAVLSQNAFYHGNNLDQGNRSAFNETCHHPKMNDQALINLGLRYDLDFALAVAARVELLFLEFAFGSLIVGGAPLRGAFFAVSVAAPKRAVYIVSSGIAKIGQKDNVALPASFLACLEVGMLFYHGAQRPKILSSYLPNPAFPVPLRFKLKKGLKSDNKKAKSSLVWLIKLDTPSFSFMFFANS
jgi:hypothetical protein